MCHLARVTSSFTQSPQLVKWFVLLCNTRKQGGINSSLGEQRCDVSYQGLQRKAPVLPKLLGVSGVLPSHQKVFWGGLQGTNLLWEMDFGAEQEPGLIPREAVWVADSAWKCKRAGKRDNSSNGSLNWDFPVHKWKSGTAASGSQESRLRKATALTQPLWAEPNKLYHDLWGVVKVVQLLGKVLL